MADQDVEKFLEEVFSENDTAKVREMEDIVLDPLLDEIDLLIQDSVKEFVRAILVRAPESFWNAASGKLGDQLYPPDEHEKGGNILHVKRVVRSVFMLSEVYDFDPEEQDIVIAAALLGSITKFLPIADDYILDPMYPYTVDRYIQEIIAQEMSSPDNPGSSSLMVEQSTVEDILRVMRCQLGRWSPIPETVPLSPAEWILHVSDMITTKMHVIIDGDEVKDERWPTGN